MVLLRCINCSRHLLIHTFIRTVAGHNHYSIYVIKKEREEAIHTVVTLKYMQRTLWSWSMIFFVCCYWWRIFRFAVAFWWWHCFFSSSIFDFRSKVYVHFLSISSSLWLDSSFSLVLWFALQTNVDGLWCDGTNYEKRFCLGIFVTLDRNCSHQHFHTTHYHLCGTVKHT